LQHQQRAATVGRIVRDAHGTALGEGLHVGDAVGVYAHRGGDGGRHRHQCEAAVIDLVVEIRLVLERVGLDVAIGQRLVRHHVIRELDHVDVQAHGLGDLGHLFHDLGMFAGRDADLDVLGRGGAGNERQRGDDGDQSLHGVFLPCCILLMLDFGISGRDCAARACRPVWPAPRRGTARAGPAR